MIRLKDIGLIELVVIQAIVYSFLWVMSEYVASLLTFIFVPLFFAIFIVAIISELIEKSKVPRKYFYFMISAIAVPIIIAGIMKLIYGVIIW